MSTPPYTPTILAYRARLIEISTTFDRNYSYLRAEHVKYKLELNESAEKIEEMNQARLSHRYKLWGQMGLGVAFRELTNHDKTDTHTLTMAMVANDNWFSENIRGLKTWYDYERVKTINDFYTKVAQERLQRKAKRGQRKAMAEAARKAKAEARKLARFDRDWVREPKKFDPAHWKWQETHEFKENHYLRKIRRELIEVFGTKEQLEEELEREEFWRLKLQE